MQVSEGIMKKHLLSAVACASVLALTTPSAAQSDAPSAGLGAGIADAAHGSDEPITVPESESWGPVESENISIANVAPALLRFVNNGPVYGLPGTVSGGVFERTQLGGDWDGLRARLAQRGVFIDAYSTWAYQDVSGGLEEGGALVINKQLSLNLDTGRLGWWSGGLLHFTMQSRFGDEPSETFTAGASEPHYYGLIMPGPVEDDQVQASEYYITQALSPRFGLIVGKTSNLFIPDQTAFANSYRYHFANFNFNKNAMTPNFYHPISWSVLAAWRMTDHIALGGGVLDPYSETDNFAEDAFEDQNYYLTAIVNYRLGNLPGQFSPAFNWSNQPQVDLTHPFGALAPAQIPQAIGALVGSPETEGLPINYDNESWFAIANFSQYLYVPEGVDRDYLLRTGQPLPGLGLFGRVGYAPDETNTVSRDASLGLFAQGLMPGRPYDSFGVAFYYNEISGHVKDDVAALSGGHIEIEDERGAEAFYDFAITPAVRFIASYQHIWDPLAARAAFDEDSTDVVMTRLTIAW
jgi:hypothetical protein